MLFFGLAFDQMNGTLDRLPQVMQLAMVAADFSAGEADRLRRAMAAWKRKGGLEPFERRLRDIHSVSQQSQGRQLHYESVGQIMLGLPPENQF